VSRAPESASQPEPVREFVSRLDATEKRPVMDGIFPFEDVPAAFARLAQGPLGKVLVRLAG
jgi:NADPH:quinone reductase